MGDYLLPFCLLLNEGSRKPFIFFYMVVRDGMWQEWEKMRKEAG